MRQIAKFFQRFPWLLVLGWYIYRIRQPKFSAGAVAVIFNQAGQILLVEHVFHPYSPWGLPGGWVDRQETPEQTILRELHEELGIAVTQYRLLYVDVVYRYHLDFAYVCEWNGAVGQLSKELLAYQWFGADQLPALSKFHLRAIQTAYAERQQRLTPV